jgi:hypothetical protein
MSKFRIPLAFAPCFVFPAPPSSTCIDATSRVCQAQPPCSKLYVLHLLREQYVSFLTQLLSSSSRTEDRNMLYLDRARILIELCWFSGSRKPQRKQPYSASTTCTTNRETCYLSFRVCRRLPTCHFCYLAQSHLCAYIAIDDRW